MKKSKFNPTLLTFLPNKSQSKFGSPENNEASHTIFCKIKKRDTVGIQCNSKIELIDRLAKPAFSFISSYTKDSSHHFGDAGTELDLKPHVKNIGRKEPKKVTKAEFYRGLVMTPRLQNIHNPAGDMPKSMTPISKIPDTDYYSSFFKSKSSKSIMPSSKNLAIKRSLSPIVKNELKDLLTKTPKNKEMNNSDHLKNLNASSTTVKISPRYYKKLARKKPKIKKENKVLKEKRNEIGNLCTFDSLHSLRICNL
ncbi:unnamed protein product [Blepharisma stoltei]|uniref:Uncharacterized protein n=1 Tax=Blepharisma stoltei TaxID=1481888 RepID=A0AAU9JV17_9CILI|nr:unnamed protein product [Blepharisma stoltei]